jgi:hypothetical protein
MEISFTPSPDISVALNALLDIFERRTSQASKSQTEHATRAIRVKLSGISLPSYFSQTDPLARLTANEQFADLEKAGLLQLTWLPGETGHLLQSVTLKTEHATRIYQLLHRSAKQDQLTRIQTLILAEKFRLWMTGAPEPFAAF